MPTTCSIMSTAGASERASNPGRCSSAPFNSRGAKASLGIRASLERSEGMSGQ
jgi:hypothetical protein